MLKNVKKRRWKCSSAIKLINVSLNYADPTFKRKRGILKKRLTNPEMNA